MNTTKDNKNMGNDEYQFPHDEYVTPDTEGSTDATHAQEQDGRKSAESFAESFAEEESKKQGKSLSERFSSFQHKRIAGVILCSVVALIVFKIMGHHQVKAVKEAPQPPVVQQVAPPAPTAISPQVERQQELLSNRLDNISKESASEHNTVLQLRQELQDLHMTVEKMEANNQKMNQAILLLSQQAEGLSNQLKKIQSATKQPHEAELTFHLRAVVPGRAWVMDSNGITNSVKVGDALTGYGLVKAINVDSGKVLTSSGKLITYNIEGN